MLDFKVDSKKYKEEFIKLLSEWVSIPSVFSNDTINETAPFGIGVKEGLEWFETLGKKDGFTTKNVDGYAVHIEYGEGEEIVYVFGHCDVVPPGDGWGSDAFKLYIEGDKLIGRGVIDDKGPLIAAYLGLKLIRESNLKINKKIRIVAGGNEESGFRCIRHYFLKEPKPTYGFTPDAKFPVIHGEKGGAILKIVGSIENKTIEIKGGEVHNTIPNYVSIKTKNTFHDVEEFSERENVSITMESIGGGECICINGRGGHSAKPENTINPIEKTIKFLSEDLNETWCKRLAGIIAKENMNGQLYGLDKEGKCGKLTMVPTIINVKNGKLEIILSVRYPEILSFKDIIDSVAKYFLKNDITQFKIEGQDMKRPNYVEKDSEIVKTLHEIYIKHTGDEESKVRVTSAGTYASEMSNSVIFGGEFPNGTSGNAHGANEFGSSECFIKSIGIYAEALYELCRL